jgi:hypothetical protein
MNFYLLDAAAGGLVIGGTVLFMMVTIALEAIAMMIMKYNKAGKAFLDSFIINLVSMGAGFLILLTGTGLFEIVDGVFFNILILFSITVAVEFILLYLLNMKTAIQKTLVTAIIINVASYLVFYLFSLVFSN